jgi:hypothetical protein
MGETDQQAHVFLVVAVEQVRQAKQVVLVELVVQV